MSETWGKGRKNKGYVYYLKKKKGFPSTTAHEAVRFFTCEEFYKYFKIATKKS